MNRRRSVGRREMLLLGICLSLFVALPVFGQNGTASIRSQT